jgi:hypothetical protein
MMETEYKEVTLFEVLKYFADGFVHHGGKQITYRDAFVDTGKGIVVFKLSISDSKQ